MTFSVNGLTARYGPIEACRNISFEVRRGEVLVLLGPNGAGKSSTMAAAAGLVSASGEVSLNGRSLRLLSAHQRAWAGLAFVPEGRRNVFGALSVNENLLLGARLLPSRDRNAMHEELYALFPILRERRDQLASMLSGGEQQLLAIAVAIARRPPALLLDEPSQGLAPVALDGLVDTVSKLRDRGLAVLLAEQNHAFAARLGDRFVALQGGDLIASGDSTELANREAAVSALMGR